MKRQRVRVRKSLGQCIAEYVMLFSAVSVAVTLMIYYMRGPIIRVIAQAANEAGKQEDAAETYKDGGADTDSTTDTSTDSTIIKREQAGGNQTTYITSDTTVNTAGTSTAEEDID